MAIYVSKGETSTGLDISCDSMFILVGISISGARDGGIVAQPTQFEAVSAKQESLRNRWTSQAFKTKWWMVRKFFSAALFLSSKPPKTALKRVHRNELLTPSHF